MIITPDERRPNVYRVQSESASNVYTVQVAEYNGQRVAVCNCLGYLSGKCKHEWRVRQMANPETDTPATEAEGTEPEQTTAVAIRGQAVADLAPVEVHVVQAMMPTRDEVAVMNMLASSVAGARGHAVPAAIDSPHKAFAVMLAGWELGIRPMTAFRHLFVVNGKVDVDGQAMMGIVTAKDPSARFYFEVADAQRCKVRLTRAGRPPVTVEYTVEDAEKSGQKGKSGPWVQYTRDMLVWAAVKRLCRLGAPELINAIEGLATGLADALYEPPTVEKPDDAGQVSAMTSAPMLPPGDPRGENLPARVKEARIKHGVEAHDLADFLGENSVGAVKRWLAERPKADVDDLMVALKAERQRVADLAAAEADTEPLDDPGEYRELTEGEQAEADAAAFEPPVTEGDDNPAASGKLL